MIDDETSFSSTAVCAAVRKENRKHIVIQMLRKIRSCFMTLGAIVFSNLVTQEFWL
jgi:hypothetical protein